MVCKVVEECKKRGTVGQTNSADTLEENNKVSALKGLFCRLLSRKQQMRHGKVHYINYGISYCFGVHEVVTGAELVFMLHPDGYENL